MQNLTNYQLSYFTLKTCTPSWRLTKSEFPIYGFVLVLDGEARYLINDNSYHVHQGDLIFFQPGDVRFAETTSGFRITAIDFTLSAGSLDIPTLSHIELSEELNILIHEFQYHWLQRNDGWELQCNGLFLSILYYFLYGKTNAANFHVEKIKRYIVDHFNEKLSIEELAQLVTLNPVYCGALFKKDLGITISEYINKIRIQKAISFLDEGVQNITEIAEICGFSDIYHFSNTFKKLMNISPSAYREHATPRKYR